MFTRLQWTWPEPGHGRCHKSWLEAGGHCRRLGSEGFAGHLSGERHPIGAEVLEWTRGQVALMRPDPKVGPLRSVVAGLMGTRNGMTAIVNEISGAMQCIALPEHHDPASQVLLGRLVPDTTLASGASLGSAFESERFVLLDRSEIAVFHMAAVPWRTRIVFIDDRSASQTNGITAMLIRPDGVIVWLSRNEGGAMRGTQSGKLTLFLDGKLQQVDEGEIAGLPAEATNVTATYALFAMTSSQVTRLCPTSSKQRPWRSLSRTSCLRHRLGFARERRRTAR